MSLVSTKEILQDAYKKGYGITAINTNGGNYDIVRALCETATEEKSPIILACYEANTPYFGFEWFGVIGKYFADRSPVPIALHMDHASSVESILKGVRYGYTSVMIDGSKKTIDENIAITNEVIKICHPLGIPVEGEVGELQRLGPGGEMEELKGLASVEDVKKYVANCDLDLLAVGIGNAHGFYKGIPNIRVDLVEQFRKITNIPMVLHGTTGIPDDVIKKCVKLGMAKINVGTLIRTNHVKYYKEVMDTFEHKNFPWRIQQQVMLKLKEDIRHIIHTVGSNGKA